MNLFCFLIPQSLVLCVRDTRRISVIAQAPLSHPDKWQYLVISKDTEGVISGFMGDELPEATSHRSARAGLQSGPLLTCHLEALVGG